MLDFTFNLQLAKFSKLMTLYCHPWKSIKFLVSSRILCSALRKPETPSSLGKYVSRGGYHLAFLIKDSAVLSRKFTKQASHLRANSRQLVEGSKKALKKERLHPC
jgi:hypothetical protein